MERWPIIVVGAGAGGLVVAIGAAKAGKRVLLIERGTWGGDCTNFGCVPSKSLIASAHAAHAIRTAGAFGLVTSGDLKPLGAMERVKQIVGRVREHEEPPALEEHGIELMEGSARFVDPHTLEVNGERVHGDKVVLAAGSRPRIPDIEGLESVPYLTNEMLFELESIPERLGVLGGGPIGCEMAQAFARLGSKVTLLHRHGCLLNREEPEAQEVIKKQFMEEGIDVVCNAVTERVRPGIELDASGETYQFDQLLVSVGRVPNADLLNLEAAGVEYSGRGVAVDRKGRTSKRHIYALGDLCGIAPFTHMAENQARALLESLIAPWNRNWSGQAVPRVTYTDPEVASAGLSELEAIERFGEKKLAVYMLPMSEVDRAITASRTEGFIKVVTRKWSSKILGCTIVAPRAGEMLPELTLAMKEGIALRKLASLVHPYPTYSLGIRQLADKWLKETVLGR